MSTVAIVVYCPECDYFLKTAVQVGKVGTHACTRCHGLMEVYVANGRQAEVTSHNASRRAEPPAADNDHYPDGAS